MLEDFLVRRYRKQGKQVCSSLTWSNTYQASSVESTLAHAMQGMLLADGAVLLRCRHPSTSLQPRVRLFIRLLMTTR